MWSILSGEVILLDWYRDWRARRTARRRLVTLMDELTTIAAMHRRVASPWRAPTRRSAISIRPMRDDAGLRGRPPTTVTTRAR